MIRLPERVFYTHEELQSVWELSESDINQYLMHGSLTAHVWLPMMSIYEVVEEQDGARIFLTKNLTHWEGYTPLYAHQCRTLFKTGEVYLREFMCRNCIESLISPEVSRCNKKLLLPESVSSVRVGIDDLVIMSEEKKRFETEHNFLTASSCRVKVMGRIVGVQKPKNHSYFEQGFRKAHHDGIDFKFGEIQAAVMQQLYDAAIEGDPWQNGKQLLNKAGSSSFTMQNVFKSNIHWRKLVESDERGSYRLQPSFMASMKEP